MDNWHEFLHNLSNFIYGSIRIFENFCFFLLQPGLDLLDSQDCGFLYWQLIHFLQYLIYAILLIIFVDLLIFVLAGILFEPLLHILAY